MAQWIQKKLRGQQQKKFDSETIIEVDKDTDNPSTAWERLQRLHDKCQLPTNTYLCKPRDKNSLRFVCLSDTHRRIESQKLEFQKRIPDGDILIHCGDFTMAGAADEIIAFDSFMARLPHPVKLVIAGNHEVTFEKHGIHPFPTIIRKQLGLPMTALDTEVTNACKDLLQHMLYLEDESVEICGIKMYFTPWVPIFGTWGFGIRRGQNLLDIWNRIPSDTDILVTHSPPCGYGDETKGNNNAGCVELLNTVVQRVKPKFHIFGHIHNGYGMWTNKRTTFINCAICGDHYKLDNEPIVFDFPLPKGFSQSDFENVTTESLKALRATLVERIEVEEPSGPEIEEKKFTDHSEAETANGRSTATATDANCEMITSGHFSPSYVFSNGFLNIGKQLSDICSTGCRPNTTDVMASTEGTIIKRSEVTSEVVSAGRGKVTTDGSDNKGSGNFMKCKDSAPERRTVEEDKASTSVPGKSRFDREQKDFEIAAENRAVEQCVEKKISVRDMVWKFNNKARLETENN